MVLTVRRAATEFRRSKKRWTGIRRHALRNCEWLISKSRDVLAEPPKGSDLSLPATLLLEGLFMPGGSVIMKVMIVIKIGDLYTESKQTLQGSFSAVSKPILASKYS